jgi:D-glycero-alpha-D-manno-heptose-7-phosphate kinase
MEINVLQRPVGKQDQYIAAFGGLTAFEFNQDDTVRVEPLRIPPHALAELENRLILFFTGIYREAPSILGDQVKRSLAGDKDMLENLDAIKALGRKIKSELERGNTNAFGELMGEHWAIKQKRSPEISNPRINGLYDLGMQHGAIGGKLIGAGGGGFLLFYTHDPEKLRNAMTSTGLMEVPFRFDHQGSTVVTRSE